MIEISNDNYKASGWNLKHTKKAMDKRFAESDTKTDKKIAAVTEPLAKTLAEILEKQKRQDTKIDEIARLLKQTTIAK